MFDRAIFYYHILAHLFEIARLTELITCLTIDKRSHRFMCEYIDKMSNVDRVRRLIGCDDSMLERFFESNTISRTQRISCMIALLESRQHDTFLEKREMFKLWHIIEAGRTDLIDTDECRYPCQALKGGHLDMVKHIFGQGQVPKHSTGYILLAAQFGHLRIIKWLCEQGFACDSDAIVVAEKHNHVGCEEWLTQYLFD